METMYEGWIQHVQNKHSNETTGFFPVCPENFSKTFLAETLVSSVCSKVGSMCVCERVCVY